MKPIERARAKFTDIFGDFQRVPKCFGKFASKVVEVYGNSDQDMEICWFSTSFFHYSAPTSGGEGVETIK